uniref:Serine protease inhibitor n=1 Tax=Penaeus japonicus TaxID=27405 RepID=W5ZZB8_PENJP|nr:serine protease inhibitor [Penaeus japonicus]
MAGRIRFVLCLTAAMAYLKPVRGQAPPSFPAYPHQEDVNTLAVSQNNFTRDMYVHLAQKKAGNLFISPFSIMTALGMTYAGAKGNTEEEMRSVLHLTQESEAVHNAFQDVVSDIKTEAPEYELRTSNMAYVSNKLSLLSEFANTLKEKYLSSSKVVDFGESEAVRKEINDIVEKETNSKIKDLIPSGVLNSLTRMVLVNAVYFKGLWQNQFNESETYDQEFWISAEESVQVPMMHIKKKFRYFNHKGLNSTILAMDYKGSRLSMVFVLPNKRDGLAEVEAKLADTDLYAIDRGLHSVEVEVSLPKFKLEESLELVEYLQGMGMKDLFDEGKSDLSGISGNRDLFVSNVIHKAFLEVNEKGSEAAAATVVGIVLCAHIGPEEDYKFEADHPFFFYIKDKLSNIILFSGRLLKP